jgi:hypothetical protein
MTMRIVCLVRAALLSTLLAVATTTCVDSAKASTFTIDASQSFLSIVVGADDGGVFTPLTTPQLPGSDSTNLLGTLEVNYSGLTIGVTSGGIDFGLQPDDMQPLPGGLPGAAPANYGLNVDLQGFVSGPGAARGLGADLALAPAPLAGNSFLSDGALLSLGRRGFGRQPYRVYHGSRQS